MLSFELLRPHQLGPYTEALHAIEAAISYPLDDDRFTIVHGRDYGSFLAGLGDAYFLLPIEDGRVLGVLGASMRTVRLPAGPVKAIYIADLKLIPSARGGRVSRRLFAHGLKLLFTHPDARGLKLVFGAGMVGLGGDVRSSFTGRHVGRLGSQLGALTLYFAGPDALAAVEGPGPSVPANGIDLSGDSAPLVRRNTGVKDFRLASTGEPWRLAHLPRPPSQWGDLGGMLREAARELEPDELGTFAIDSRLTEVHAWLRTQGLMPGAGCNVLGLVHPLWGRRALRSDWLHLSTAEI